MNARLILSFAVLLVVSVAPCGAGVAAQYTLTDLGTLGGSGSGAVGLNNLGQVVGYSFIPSGDTHAFLWDGGAMQDLGTLGGSSCASDINDSGMIVGWSYAASAGGYLHAFRRDPGGALQDLGTMGGPTSATGEINDSGQIVGAADTPQDDPQNMRRGRAFLMNPGGAMQDLGTLGGPHSGAGAINSGGWVVGSADINENEWHAFLYAGGGALRDLGTLGGATSAAYAVSDNGTIVGTSDTSFGVSRAFRYCGNGPMEDLGALRGNSSAFGVNDRGEIVGSSDGWAFIYTGSGAMLDLNGLVDAPGWNLVTAYDINDSGQIVGFGQVGDTNRAFLLNPIPEPGTFTLLLAAVSAVALLAWLRCANRHAAL
jgi:probable HAF family extracellular repeat protein